MNDPQWQALRSSLVGTWKKTPVENVARLRAYLAEDPACPLRLRRLHNYLTGSGFRLGIISHPAVDQLLAEVRRKRGR